MNLKTLRLPRRPLARGFGDSTGGGPRMLHHATTKHAGPGPRRSRRDSGHWYGPGWPPRRRGPAPSPAARPAGGRAAGRPPPAAGPAGPGPRAAPCTRPRPLNLNKAPSPGTRAGEAQRRYLWPRPQAAPGIDKAPPSRLNTRSTSARRGPGACQWTRRSQLSGLLPASLSEAEGQ